MENAPNLSPPNADQEVYDLVVIGSGLGGLLCAVFFVMEGKKVCVLERNKQLGGNLQTYNRDKVVFDSGVHYVGSLDEGQTLNKVFRYVGIMDKLELRKMSPSMVDGIMLEPNGKLFPYGQGYDNFIAAMVAAFPEEEAAIKKYCEEIQRVCEKFPLYNLREGGAFEKNDVLELDTRTFIESLTQNETLRNVLAGTNLLYAGEGYKTPLYVHALIVNSYLESSYRFAGGGSQIAKWLTRKIVRSGSVVKNGKQVIRLVEEGGKIAYAETDAGERYYGSTFISNAHPANTMQLVQSDLIKKAYRNRVSGLQNSISIFSLNVVMHPKSFPYMEHNIYYFDKGDVWGLMDYQPEEWPNGFALFCSTARKQDAWAEGFTIMAYMHYRDTEPWQNTFNTVMHEKHRGESYEKFKVGKAEKLINLVDRNVPGFKQSIKSWYAATPLTMRDYLGTDDGSLYGISKDFRDPLRTFISPRTRIPNLLLTGQNLNLHGVLGVAMSSIVTCSEVFGMGYLLNKIRNA